METTLTQPLKPLVSLAERVTKADLAVTSCFQCRKCSGGCPLTFGMDLLPHQVIRLTLLGQEERVLGSRTIWACSGCQTCTTRCPNGVDIAGTMDWLKEEAVKQGFDSSEKRAEIFHRYFLESIAAGGGRLSETKLLRRYTFFKLRRKFDLADIKQDLRLGWNLWKRGRVRLRSPAPLRGKAQITEIFRKAQF